MSSFGLGRVPVGFYNAVHHGGLERRTEIRCLPVVVESTRLCLYVFLRPEGTRALVLWSCQLTVSLKRLNEPECC